MTRGKTILCAAAMALLAQVAVAREAVVVVSAHPDDIAACSGTLILLAERYDVHVIDFTHGEYGLDEKGALDGSTKRMRTKEEEAVCAELGFKLHWLDEIDSMAFASRETTERFTELLREINPRAILMHWPIDIHCDHVMSSASAWRAILFAGLRGSCEIYFHDQTVQCRSFRPSVFVDVSRVEERKEKVIGLYKCQQPDELVDRRHTDAKFWGFRIGVKYAEAFAVADGTVKGPGILAGLSPDKGVVSLQTPGQKAYFEMVRSVRENSFSNATFRAAMCATGDRPAPVALNWGAGEPPYAVTVTRDGESVWSATLPARSAEVFNLEIARTYEWMARDAKDNVVGAGRFRTADEAPRFIRIPGVPNVRDLGGRIGLGGRRIRQGLVYRSAGWNENAVRSIVTNGASVVTNWVAGASRISPIVAEEVKRTLGIRTDLDLRSDNECRGMTGSPLGEDVRWVHVSSGNYWDMTNALWKAAFAADFRVFLDRANYPIVFHCIAGADRTGSLACILNALLGVGEDELAKDWEATGFVNEHPKLRHDIRWDPLVRAFDGYPGATLNARIEAYVKDCGFTDGDLARFRAIMMEEGD